MSDIKLEIPETNIRDYDIPIKKFNETFLRWQDGFSSSIYLLMDAVKSNDIDLDEVKKLLNKIFDKELDQYHKIEKFNLI